MCQLAPNVAHQYNDQSLAVPELGKTERDGVFSKQEKKTIHDIAHRPKKQCMSRFIPSVLWIYQEIDHSK